MAMRECGLNGGIKLERHDPAHSQLQAALLAARLCLLTAVQTGPGHGILRSKSAGAKLLMSLSYLLVTWLNPALIAKILASATVEAAEFLLSSCSHALSSFSSRQAAWSLDKKAAISAGCLADLDSYQL